VATNKADRWFFFYWYEAPIPDSDLIGLVDLTRSFEIRTAQLRNDETVGRVYRSATAGCCESIDAVVCIVRRI
jgi:hypothetical protein